LLRFRAGTRNRAARVRAAAVAHARLLRGRAVARMRMSS
jgi:hypothetical protein